MVWVSGSKLLQNSQIAFHDLGHAGMKNEGLIVPKDWGAEGKVVGNVLAGDEFSVAFEF